MTEYYMYKTKQGDRWDLIASKFYGNQYDYKDIISANPHIPIKPVIDADTEIRIPVKDLLEENNVNFPYWKRED